MFLDNLDESWKRRNKGGTVMVPKKIFLLKFADDVALVAEDAQSLNDVTKVSKIRGKKLVASEYSEKEGDSI